MQRGRRLLLPVFPSVLRRESSSSSHIWYNCCKVSELCSLPKQAPDHIGVARCKLKMRTPTAAHRIGLHEVQFFDKNEMRATITTYSWNKLPSIVVYDYEKIMDFTCTCVEKNGKNFDDERRNEGTNEGTKPPGH